MASNYGPHFGVRRWDEDVAIREGRFKTPATGSRLLVGSAVEVDFAADGYMKQAVANRPLETGVSGLLVWEDQFLQVGPFGTIDAPYRRDISELAYARVGKYAVIAGGAGSKFWFKNVAARTTTDGETTFSAINIVAGLGAGGVVLGSFLGWNGTEFAVIAAGAGGSRPAGAWFRVVNVNDAASYCEAVLLGDGA